MMDTEDPSKNEKLVHAYNRMMERVQQAIKQADKEARPIITNLIEAAKDAAVELEEITREEAEKIGEYLRRDVEDAADYLAGPDTQDLAAWLKFDLGLIEERLLEMFTSVADPTRVELMAIEERARHAGEFHTGEISGIGTLACKSCGQLIHFHSTGHIPPCPKCHATVFTRPKRQ